MKSDGAKVEWVDKFLRDAEHLRVPGSFAVAPGQSALSSGGMSGHLVLNALQTMRTVEVDPTKVAEPQEPTSTQEFESGGSNVVSVYESLSADDERTLVELLQADWGNRSRSTDAREPSWPTASRGMSPPLRADQGASASWSSSTVRATAWRRMAQL